MSFRQSPVFAPILTSRHDLLPPEFDKNRNRFWSSLPLGDRRPVHGVQSLTAIRQTPKSRNRAFWIIQPIKTHKVDLRVNTKTGHTMFTTMTYDSFFFFSLSPFRRLRKQKCLSRCLKAQTDSPTDRLTDLTLYEISSRDSDVILILFFYRLIFLVSLVVDPSFLPPVSINQFLLSQHTCNMLKLQSPPLEEITNFRPSFSAVARVTLILKMIPN